MKKTYFLLFFINTFISCNKSTDIKEFNKELIHIVKENSLYSDSLNWKVIEKELDSISNLRQNADKYSNSVKYIISKLRDAGDNHTHYMEKALSNKMKEQNLSSKQPIAKYLGANIAYLKIPDFASRNKSICNQFAINIQQLIKTMETHYIKGWIVDLRDNIGGTMEPMIAGLGPLLGEDTLGYTIYKNGKKISWSYRNGSVIEATSDTIFINKGENIEQKIKNTKTVIVPNPYKVRKKKFKIAILVNEKTCSAGEFTAISFIGKSNVKLFGQTTGGLTTGNDAFLFADGSLLNLETSLAADRNMKIYKGGIIPNVIIYDYMYNDDRSLNEAIKWIKKSK